MIGISILVILSLALAFLSPVLHRRPAETKRSAHYDIQMKRLWSAAQTSMRDHKPLRAEKALLTILKFDEKNAAAYNRLGILYAKEQKFDEAIECFEIAQSLDNNPSSLHNVGLIYLETGAYEKAAMAFEQALELEADVPARFIALAKAKERLGQPKAAIEALEHAYSLDHSTNTLRLILAIHESTGDLEALAATTARIEQQIAETARQNAVRRMPRTRTPRTRLPASTTQAQHFAQTSAQQAQATQPARSSQSLRQARPVANTRSLRKQI